MMVLNWNAVQENRKRYQKEYLCKPMVDCSREAVMIYFVSKILIFICMHADILVYYGKGVL
jgi:hypothetical protein